jgi:hypothetical protein
MKPQGLNVQLSRQHDSENLEHFNESFWRSEDDRQRGNLDIFLLHISYVCRKKSEIEDAARGQKTETIRVCLCDLMNIQPVRLGPGPDPPLSGGCNVLSFRN